jgi:tetratricopeptide (TPR) repeat protein
MRELNIDEGRAVRVFISSTFIDMQGERDELVRKTFPALRAEFRTRGVEFVEIDLRWGVTQEDLESTGALPICLAEVDRCRPYFIGLLGERYGSLLHEDKVTPDLAEAFPVLREGVGRSLTEIEILHGVLSDPAAAKRAFFFERDPAWLDELSAEERGQYAADTDEARAMLADLKVRIRASGATVTQYHHPQDIGVAVQSTFGVALLERFPADEAPDAFTQALRLHASFARERRGLHIGAAPYLSALDAWMAQADRPPMVITGASGGGKSTLVANWLARHRAAAPEDIVFEHYLGASPDSADPGPLIRRLWGQLNLATGEAVEPPSDDLALIDGLPDRLAQANTFALQRGLQILIALDGLDKLSSRSDLSWLPLFLPPRVKLLASSLEGGALEATRTRGWDGLEIKPLSDAERRLFVASALEGWGRKLSLDRTERVLGHPLAGRPIFLKTVLDELRYSGTEARLDPRLDFYLAASDLPDLFTRMLERFEGDCGVGLVRSATSLIWASRAGLEEAEIVAIAGTSPLAWATLRNGLADALRDQDGRVTFSHDYLRQAVRDRYLRDVDLVRAAHLKLADHFDAGAWTARHAEEVPFQLSAAEAWDRLEALLVNIDRFILLSARGGEELLGHWLRLAPKGCEPEALLCGAFDADRGDPETWTDADINLAFGIGAFLRFAGAAGEATLRLDERRTKACEVNFGPENINTLISMANLAGTLKARRDFAGAQALQERVLEVEQRRYGSDHPSTLTSMNNLAGTLKARGDLAGAQALHERVTEASARLFGPDHTDTLNSTSNLAGALYDRGLLAEARTLQEGVVEARTRLLGPAHPDTLFSMANLAEILRNCGDLAGAQTLEEQVLEGRVRLLGLEHPLTLNAMTNLANTLHARGDLDGAQAHHQRALKARLRLFGAEHQDTLTSMSWMAEILHDRGDLAGAQQLREHVCEGLTSLLGPEHPSTLRGLNNLAENLSARGDVAGARTLHERVFEARTRWLGPDHPDTLTSMNNVAGTRYASGDLEGARKLQERALEARMRLHGPDHPETLTCMHNLAGTLSACGDMVGAEALQESVVQSMARRLGSDHPHTLTSMLRLAKTLKARGDVARAQELQEQAVGGRVRVLGPDHTSTLMSINDLAVTIYERGDFDTAQELFEHTSEAWARLFGPEHPNAKMSAKSLATVKAAREARAARRR